MNQKHISKISELISSQLNNNRFRMSVCDILEFNGVSLDDLMKITKFNKTLKENGIYLLSTICDIKSKSDCHRLIEKEKNHRIWKFKNEHIILDYRKYTRWSEEHEDFLFFSDTHWEYISHYLSNDILWDIVKTFVKLDDEILLKLLESIMSDDEFRYYKLFN